MLGREGPREDEGRRLAVDRGSRQRELPMKTNRRAAALSACVLACVAFPAGAADRVHAGQWVGSWTDGTRTRATSSCMSQADADAMNGDAKSIQAYLEKTIPPSICKLSDIKVDGGKVSYTSACAGGAPKLNTTLYHGDSFESFDSKGAKSAAKRVGACPEPAAGAVAGSVAV